MVTALDPLTPPDCNLRGLPFMPLDVQRLRDSDMAAVLTGEEFRCAVLLWCASWHQIPAASLPDDDKVLASLAGYARTPKEWRRHREGALRGWVKCSDGRLYHPVIAEKALQAWDMRNDHREVNENKSERQGRWRARVKELSASLRDLGVTPPANASLKVLEELLDSVSNPSLDLSPTRSNASTERLHVDATETAKTGTGTGTGTGTYNNNSNSRSESPAVQVSGAGESSTGPGGCAEGYPGAENLDPAGPMGMTIGWEPLSDLPARLVIAGIPGHLDTTELRSEFVSYWLSNGARASPAEWTHKYFQRLQQIKIQGNHHARPQSQSAQASRSRSRASVSDRIRSANGLDQPDHVGGVTIDATAE